MFSFLRKFWRYKITVFVLLSSLVSLFAQPTADSAKYISNSQDIISVYFSEVVTLTDLTGWTIDIGGTIHTEGPAPAGMVLAGITDNRVDIKLFFSSPKTNIEYSDVVAGIYVNYDGSGDLSQAVAPNTPVVAFNNLPAINDVIITCSMLSSVQSIGTASSSGPCQSITIQYYIEWNWNPVARNSIHFNPNGIVARIFYRDVNSTAGQEIMTEDGVGSGKFTVTTPSFTYPIEDVCSFNPTVYPRFYRNSGDAEQPNLTCSGGVNQQDYVIPAYRLDNEELDGILSIDPAIGTDPTLYCVGEDIEGFVFNDVTTFNCNVSVEPDRPNEGQRWMKFVYGTHTTNGIPDVWIDVYGTQVYVTDGNGDPITGPFTIDPETGGTVAAYTTSSGFFESEVFTVPEPCTAPIASTYPIHHTGNYATDEGDDVFGVTLQNWGPCNQWDQWFPATPIEIYDELRLIPAPPPPTVSSPTECIDAVSPSITATGTGGTIKWFDDPSHDDPADLVNTGGTYTHGETNEGVYTWWVNESMSTGGPVECVSDTVRSTLTINPLTNKPDINISGPTDFCFDGGTTDVTLNADPNEPPTVTRYQWYRDGGAIGGATSSSITLDAVAESGSYTVRSYGIAPTDCEGPLSDPVTINIFALAAATDPPNRTICEDSRVENGNTTFSSTVSGAARTLQWQRSSNGGTTWVDITGTTTPNDGCDYSNWNTNVLTIQSADYLANGYEYRLKMTTTAGGCETFSNPGTLTVNPTPDIDTEPSNTTICEFDNTTFTVVSSIDAGSISTYAWQQENTYLSGGHNPEGVYSTWNNATLTVTGPSRALDNDRHRVFVTSDQGCRERSLNRRLYINELADITTQPQDEEICIGDNVSFSVATDGDPVVTGYQWQVSTNGGSTWNNVVGGEYSGQTSDELDITNVLIGKDANQYRVILTTFTTCTIISDPAELTVNPEPDEKTIVSADNNICYGTSTEVVIQTSQSGVQYSVYNAADNSLIGTVNGNGGNATVSTGALTNASYTYYVIARNVTTTCERRNTDEVTIDVNPRFEQAQMHDDQSICSGASTDFWVTLTGGTAPYTLRYSDGSVNTDIANYNSDDLINTGALFSDVTYNVVEVWDANGCTVENTGTAITIVVGALPTAAIFSGGSDICVGTNTSLRVNVTGGAPPFTMVFDNALLGTQVTPDFITDFALNGLAVGVYDFDLQSVTDACGNSVPVGNISGNTQTVTVHALPDASTTANNNATICNNSATSITLDADIVGTTFTWNVVDADGAGASNGAGGIGDVIGQTLVNGTDDPVFVIYEISPSGPTGCPGTQVDRTVYIEPIPQAAIANTTPAVCHNGNVNITVTSPTSPTVAGDLTFDLVVTSTNDGALGGTASSDISGSGFPRNINGNLTNSSNAAITVTYTVTPLLNGCPDGPDQQTTVVVEPTPVGAMNNTTPVVCQGTNVNIAISSPTLPSVAGDLVFDLDVDSDNNGALGGTASVDLSDQSFPMTLNGTLTNSSSAPITVTYTLTPKLSGCSDGVDVVETIVVEPTPQAAIANAAAVICNGDNVDLTITSPTTASVPADLSFDLLVTSTDDANLGGAASNDLSSQSFPLNITGVLTNASNADIVVTYTVTPEINGCAVGPVATTTVTVEPTPVALVNNTTPLICEGGNVNIAITSPTVPSVPANLSFDLVVTSDNDAALGGTASGDLSSQSFPVTVSGTLTNSSDAPITVTYTVTPALSGCGTGTPVVRTVVVEPAPVAAIVNGASTVCNGGNVDLTISSPTAPTVAGDLSFNVAVTSTDDANLGGTASGDLAGQSFPHTISGTLTNASNSVIAVTYTVTPMLDGCANGPDEVTTVMVEPTPRAALNNLATEVCSGGNVNIGVTSPSFVSVAANLVFDLAVSSTDDASVGGTAFAALTDQAFPHTLNGTLTNSSDNDIVVTFTVTPKLAGCAAGPDQVTTVTLEPTPQAAIANVAPVICTGGNVDLSITSPTVPSVPGDLGFDLVVTSDGGAALGGTASGNLSNQSFPRSLGGTLTNSSDDYITVTYTVTPTLNGCANGPDAVTTVIVEPAPKAAISTGTPVICSGSNVSVPITSPTTVSVPANLTFDLALTSTNDGAMGGTAWGNLTGQSFPLTVNGTLTNSSNADITVTFTATPRLASCASGTPVAVTLVVEPTPQASWANTTAAICTGDMVNLVVNSLTVPSVPGNLTFDVALTPAADPSLGGTAYTDLNDVSVGHLINGTLSNTSNAPIVVTYTVTPKLAGCASGAPVATTVTVNPKPDVIPTNNVPVFPTGDFTDIELDGSVAGTTFGWRIIRNGNTGGFDDDGLAIGGSIAQQLFNATAAPVTATYRIAPTANGCLGDSVDVTVQIDPNVDMTVVNDPMHICTGGSSNLELSSSVAGATFSWTVTDADGAGANPGSGGPNTHTIQEVLTNVTTAPITVTYHITPTGPAPTNIVGATQDHVVTIYPTPLGIYDNRNAEICDGSATDIGLDSDVAGSLFTWTVTDPTGGASGAAGSGAGSLPIGASITQTLVNDGTTAFTVIYHIRPTGQGGVNCPGAITDVPVVVHPTPIANITPTFEEICSETATDIGLNASVIGSSFTYTVIDPKGTGAVDGTGVIGDRIQQTLVNSTQTPVDITYVITPYGPGATACPGPAVNVDVTVLPLPITSDITGIDTVCEATADLVFAVDHTSGSFYEWNVPVSIGNATFGGTGLDSYAVILTASSPAVITTDSIWVFETNQHGCTRDTIYHPMTVIPTPPVQDITGDDAVCALSEHNYSVPDNAGSTYQWFVPPGASITSADPTINNVDVLFGLISGQVRVIETSAGGCVTTHNPKSITVNQLPISTISASQIAACDGDTITFSAGPVTGLNYEFLVNGVTAQNGPSYVFETADLNDQDIVGVNVTSADGCVNPAVTLTITIYDPPVVTLVSSDADNIICFGENVAFTATSASAVNYNFFLNGVSQQSGPLNFWNTLSLVNGDAVHVEVLSSFGCWGGSDTISTLVNDLPVGVLSGDNTICPGDFTDLAVNVTVGLAPYEVTIDNAVPVQSGYNSGDPIAVSPEFSTTYSLVSITDANLCTSAILTASSGNLSGTAEVIVRDTVQILTQPHDAQVCEGIDTSFTVGAMGDGLLYQWESTQDLTAGFVAVVGGTSATLPVLAPDASMDSTWYRVRVYSSFCNPESYSDTVQLVLKYDPDLVGHPLDQTICENDGTGFGVDAGLTFNPIYTWEISYDNGSSWLSLGDTAVYNGTTTDSLIVISASSRFDGYQYRSTVTGECGTPIISNVAVLSIDERPEILSHPSDTAVCETEPLSFAVDAGVTTAAVYAWEVDMGSGFVALGDTAGVYAGTATDELSVQAPSSRFNGYQYRAIVSGACPVPMTSNPALLIVSEIPEIVTQPEDTVICENESPFFTVNAGVTTGASYVWEVSYDNGVSWLELGDTAIYTGTSSNTLRLTGAPSTDDGNLYHVIVSGVCTPPVTSVDVTLTVRERPEILSQPADIIVCESDPAAFNVDAGVTTAAAYQWQVNMNDGNGFVDLGDTAGVYAGANAADLDVLLTESRFNGYQYRVIVTGDCTPPQTSSTAVLTVNEIPEITLQPVPVTICEEQNAFFTISTGVTTNASIQWQVDMGSGFVDIGADTGIYSGTGTPNLFMTLVPSTYEGYRYHAVVSGACAPAVTSDDVLLTVHENPEILVQPENDTICEGDPASYTVDAGVTTNVVYLWQVNRVGLWEDLDDVSGDYTGSDTDMLTVNNPVSTYNGYRYRVIVSGECTPALTSSQALLVVDERPEILTQPEDEAICEDSDVIFVVSPGVTTEPVILWEYSTDGVTWIAAAGLPEVSDDTNDTLFISAVPSTYDTYQFHAVLGGKCPADVTSDPAVLTVYEKPQIDVQPVDVTACEQDTISFFVDAGPSTNPVYQWEIWNGAAWTIPPPDIYSGTDSDTLYINGIHSGLDQLQVRLRLSGICTPEQVSDTAILTVNERPEVLEQPENLAICEGDSAVFGISAGVTTAPVYTWEYYDGSAWQSAVGGGLFEDENTDTLRLYGVAGVPSTWTNTQFRAIVGNLCGPNDTSNVVRLVVNERPEILAQPLDAITCENVASTFTIDAGVTTSPSYLWQVHNGTFWAPVTGTQYSGQGTANLSVMNPISTMNGYGFRVLLMGACDPYVISDSVSLTVLENPEINLQPVGATICEGGDTTFVIDAGVTTNPVYKWYYNDNVNGWLEVTADGIHSGFDTNTLTVSGGLFSMDNWMYRVEVTGDCGTPVISQSAGLIVYKLPEIIEQPADTTTCELMNVSFSVDVGDTDAPFLQWEEYDGAAWSVLSDGGNYIGVNTTELKVYTVDSSMTGFRYRVRVMGECEPEVLSDEAELIVNSAPDIWLQPVDATTCEGDNTSFTMTATGTNITYHWQVDSGSGFADISDSNGGVYSGWDSNTLDLTGADRTYNFNKYRIRVEGDCAPMAISDLAILFVQTPAEIQTQPTSDTICEFENASFNVSATGESLDYQWQESRDDGATWSDLSDVGLYIGSQSPNLTIFSVDRGSDGFRYQVVITGSCGVPATSDEIVLSVETSPEILVQPEALTACENMPAGFGVDAQGTNIVYRWQVNEGSGFSDIDDLDGRFTGADSDTLTLVSAQLDESGFSFRVTITGNCVPPATSNPVLLLVNANPGIDIQPVDAAICEDGLAVFSADASGPELMYQWYVDKLDGFGFVALVDDTVHLGANTDQIQLTNTPVTQDGWQYRLDVFNACAATLSSVVTLTVYPNPAPTITPVPLADHPNYPQICGGDVLTLDGAPTSGSGSYTLHQWSGSIGPLSAIDQQVVDFMTVVKGSYDLAYTVTDDRGCKGSDVVTIENDRPTAQFVSNAVPSCGYMEVDFTNTSSADAVSFLWDFDDETTSTQKDVTHGFDNEDVSGQVAYYNINMVASSVNGCNDTAVSVVTIYPKVIAEITADPQEGCHPLQSTLLAQPGAAGYSWVFGDGSAPQDGSYIAYHLFENFGTEEEVYTVSLTTTSHYGCSDTETLDITVQPIPQPNFTAVPLVQTYPDATVSFSNTTSDGPWTFLWNFGDTITSTEESPTHVYADPGTYDVDFYVMNGECMDSSKTTVVIHPRIPIAAFDEPVGGCNPVEIEFVNQSQWATTYLWDFGDGYVSTKENPTHSFYDVGQFTIRLTATGPGGTDYASWTVDIWETPNVAFNSAPDSVFVKDKPVRFYNLTAGATDYSWDFGDYYEDGSPAPGNFSSAGDTSHIYFTEGYKDVTLVAWNEHCSDSITLPAVKVIPKGELEFPTVFRPDPSGPSGGYVDPNDPSVDPSYANSIFFPGVNKQVDEYHLYVYNRWGEQIFQSNDINVGWDGYVKGQLAAQGVYFWKVNVVYKNGAPDTARGDITLLHKSAQ